MALFFSYIQLLLKIKIYKAKTKEEVNRNPQLKLILDLLCVFSQPVFPQAFGDNPVRSVPSCQCHHNSLNRGFLLDGNHKWTIFYGLHRNPIEIQEYQAMLAERNSLAAIHRIKGIKVETVVDWFRNMFALHYTYSILKSFI
jgi:hypothetical protein